MSEENVQSESAYSPSEMMIVSSARALAGVRTVFVGVGQPNIACNLARYTVSPNLELIYESGVYGAQPARLPLSIGDPTLVTGATSVISMADLFGLYLQRGLVEVALLGGAQIDRYGNLNTSVIGSYTDPKTRLPGSGGACEIAINAQRVFIIMHLKKRAFVEQLDFLTSPGHLSGGDARQALGMPGGGPELVITDMAIFNFANAEREMQLVSLYPGVTLAQVQAEIGWQVKLAETISQAIPPTSEELQLIRVQLDPTGMYSKRVREAPNTRPHGSA
jgi:glutaconate CoA-transferase subunit B